MIRRELNTTDVTASWLLISQVEHARVSGVLAQRWTAADLSPRTCDGEPVTATTVDEILAAVSHHDDGWIEWERAPQIDPTHGRPYSFMSEMPFGDALAIWDGSIAAARALGPLAGWMVASHFRELLASGVHLDDELAVAWLAATEPQRVTWLAEWQRADDRHTPRLATRALRLLQACDLLSLWLACDCPLAAHEQVDHVEPFRLHWRHDAVGPYRLEAWRCAPQSSNRADPFRDSTWRVTGQPWPFADEAFRLTANVQLVPARRYASSAELLAACRPVALCWSLVRQP